MAWTVEMALTIVGTAVAGVGGSELTKFYDNSGVMYRESLVNFLTPVFGSRDFAETVAKIAPALVVPMAMAVRISIKELTKILYGKTSVKELTGEELRSLSRAVDDGYYHGDPVPNKGDMGLKIRAGGKNKPKAFEGKETMQEGGLGNKGGKTKGGETRRRMAPHVHDRDGLHIPK